MNRRWRQEAAHSFFSLEPCGSFQAQLPVLEKQLGIADFSDVYATYSTLHSKGRNPRLQANTVSGFYYFLADADMSESAPMSTEPEAPRVEAVVPVSSKHTGLTMATIKLLSNLQGSQQAAHILLAVVDDDGSVSLMRCFNYIQPPFEGPETLPPMQVGPTAEDSD